MSDFIVGSSENQVSSVNYSALDFTNVAWDANGTVSSNIDSFLEEYIQVKYNPDKLLKLLSKKAFECLSEKYPEEKDSWEIQLKLSKNDYEQTILYMIEYIRSKKEV